MRAVPLLRQRLRHRINREIASGALRRPRNRLRQEHGQVLVTVVLSIGLLLVFAAFAVDTAMVYVAHHRAQVAADAGALSAAQDMDTAGYSDSQVQTDGTAAATSNDSGASVTISEPSSIQAKAVVSTPVNLLFGFGSGKVSAQAVAAVDTSQTDDAGGVVLGTACADEPCTYDSPEAGDGNALIPSAGDNQTAGWEVTNNAEDPTPAGENGDSTVNIQACDGDTNTAGECYEPGSTAPVASNTLTQVIDLNGESEGGMWQTVPTTPGATYVLSFWLTGNPGLDGWPGPTDNAFPLDVWITSGSGSSAQYTPSYTPSNMGSGATSTTSSSTGGACGGRHPSDYVACEYWDYHDEVCGASGVTLQSCTSGTEQADFSVESLTFVADSSSTTITFNSEVNDEDKMDGSEGWFYCGPEVTNIRFGPPAIVLAQ